METRALARSLVELTSREGLIWRSKRIWWKEDRQTLEICELKESSGSNSTPRLRAWRLGGMEMPRKESDEFMILERC